MKIGRRWLQAAAGIVRREVERTGDKSLKVDLRGLASRMRQQAITVNAKDRRDEAKKQWGRDWTPVPGSKMPIKPMRRLPRYILAGANRA